METSRPEPACERSGWPVRRLEVSSASRRGSKRSTRSLRRTAKPTSAKPPISIAQVSGPISVEKTFAPDTTLSTPSENPFLLGVSGRSSRPVKINASSDGGGTMALSGSAMAAKLPLSTSSAAIAGQATTNHAATRPSRNIVVPIAVSYPPVTRCGQIRMTSRDTKPTNRDSLNSSHAIRRLQWLIQLWCAISRIDWNGDPSE